MGSTVACTTREQTLDHIESIKPEQWTQKEVCGWLKLKNGGEFKPLIQTFKQNKISGLTFVRLTIDDLKEKLDIKQFGLRDSFIVARDQVIELFNHSQVNARIHTHIGPKMERTVSLNTTLPFNIKDHSTLLTKSNTSEVCEPSSLLSNTYESQFQLSLSTRHSLQPSLASADGLITSNDILFLFANKQYLYIDLCHVVVQQFCRQTVKDINMETKQQNIIDTLCFNYYFENERHIKQFAYDVWKTLSLIDIKTVHICETNVIRGFTGADLMQHISSHLPRYELCTSDVSALIDYAYIRLVAIIDDSCKLVTKFKNRDKDNVDKNYFEGSAHHLYQIENDRHREFIKQYEPDRDSWHNGCNVSVYSETLKRWNIATIIDINDEMITVQYAGNIRKTLDRYQDHNVIKSTAQYIESRKNWAKHSELQIYSKRHQNWFLGEIRQVIVKNDEQLLSHDIFEVHYTDSESKLLSKYVERWSPDVREISSQIHDCLSVFKIGSKVMVWSKSRERWLPGVITGVVQQHKIVNVRYGDCEKLLPWNSNDLQLCDGNAKSLLEAYKQNRNQHKK